MSPGNFQVGDVVEVISAEYHPENIGQEFTIVAPYGLYRPANIQESIWCYRIQRRDGKYFFAYPHELRKKRPPELGEWELCPWQPKPVEVRS